MSLLESAYLPELREMKGIDNIVIELLICLTRIYIKI